MNVVNLIGRWVRDHEVVETNSGVTIVKNTIAVDHPFKKDDSSFLRVVMFNKTGELANQYTGKGTRIALMGHIQSGSYEKDGQKVFTVDIIADKIEFLEPKKDKENVEDHIPKDWNNPSAGAGGNYNAPNNAQNQQQGTQNNQGGNTNNQGYNNQGGSGGQSQGYNPPNANTNQSNRTNNDPFQPEGGPIEVDSDDLPF